MLQDEIDDDTMQNWLPDGKSIIIAQNLSSNFKS
jgi:hypothetical protein